MQPQNSGPRFFGLALALACVLLLPACGGGGGDEGGGSSGDPVVAFFTNVSPYPVIIVGDFVDVPVPAGESRSLFRSQLPSDLNLPTLQGWRAWATDPTNSPCPGIAQCLVDSGTVMLSDDVPGAATISNE